MSYPQETFVNTTLKEGSLIAQRRQAAFQNTAKYQLDVLKQTGRYDAFRLKWHPVYDQEPEVWPVPPHLFWDSDVAKWIEGACYLLHSSDQPELEHAVHELVDMIAAAQQPDGYINIHFTVVKPQERFINLRDLHELYNCGHLIEAALAHEHLFKDDKLMAPMLRYVDLLYDTFGAAASKTPGYPGHPEIELALLRLYERTGNPKHLELARFFITERGNPRGYYGKHYYEVEALRRGEGSNVRPGYWPSTDCLWYYQAHKPIVEQETIEGHSVRAMYLLTAAADLVRIEGHDTMFELGQAVRRLWDNMVNKKMYVTGGIGSMKQFEGFGLDHYLPQGTDEGGCYCETCAAIGVMMLAQRMLQYDPNVEYSDTMELCLYNAVLTSMSSDGKTFTYINQLASSDTDLSKREEWFTCACCPPNVFRLLGQIGGYIWSTHSRESSVEVAVHLFISSILRLGEDGIDLEVTQESNWPWSGEITFSVKGSADVELRIRIPTWAEEWRVIPEPPRKELEKGYLSLPATWLKQNPSFTLSIPLQCRIITPHPFTNQDTVSVARGPIVYCVEDFDNPWVEDHFKSTYFDTSSEIVEEQYHDATTGESFVKLFARNAACVLDMSKLVSGPMQNARLASTNASSDRKLIDALNFVPYYTRANRGGKGHMRVGLKRWHRS